MRIVRSLFILVFSLWVCSVWAGAQQTSTTETVKGEGNQQVEVQSGEVVAVDGNNLFVRMSDGNVQHFVVPPDAKAIVDGQEVGVSDLKPGTKLSRSITTTRTPNVVRTTTKIEGRVFSVNPPVSVILTGSDGVNRQYFIPKDQKINVNGEEVDAFSLKKGMKINATVTKEVPEEVVTSEKSAVVGQAPPAPEPAKPAEETTAAATPQAEPAAAPAAPAEQKALPQTASPLPLLGLLGGILSLAGWRTMRRRS
jgi:hypothetical protein